MRVLSGSRTALPFASTSEQLAQPLSSEAWHSSDNGGGGGRLSSIRLYYKTQWSRASLHCSIGGGEWSTVAMEQVPVSAGRMFCVELAVPEQAPDGAPALEFVMTDGKGQWDNRPEDGGKNYQINGAGRFILEQGRLTRSSGRRMMVVSDLDGTMVGEDAATAEFRDFWEDRALARGSKLVFNSGRTLESIQQLLCEKQHCLALPDACICAVGTRVFWREPGSSEGGARALTWREDEAWGAVLDRAWDLAAVRDAAYAALAMVGKERMHFRPPEEQNDHKVTCGLATDVAQQVVAHIEAHLADHGVVANIVVSGIGDWRFMDVVPVAAGKLEATKHVQQQLGFMPDETIACGDSGNDILLLAGDHLAVAVGNAHPDLVSWVEQQHGSPEVKERLFRASRTTASGILEGLQRFGFDIHLA